MAKLGAGQSPFKFGGFKDTLGIPDTRIRANYSYKTSSPDIREKTLLYKAKKDVTGDTLRIKAMTTTSNTGLHQTAQAFPILRTTLRMESHLEIHDYEKKIKAQVLLFCQAQRAADLGLSLFTLLSQTLTFLVIFLLLRNFCTFHFLSVFSFSFSFYISENEALVRSQVSLEKFLECPRRTIWMVDRNLKTRKNRPIQLKDSVDFLLHGEMTVALKCKADLELALVQTKNLLKSMKVVRDDISKEILIAKQGLGLNSEVFSGVVTAFPTFESDSPLCFIKMASLHADSNALRAMNKKLCEISDSSMREEKDKVQGALKTSQEAHILQEVNRFIRVIVIPKISFVLFP